MISHQEKMAIVKQLPSPAAATSVLVSEFSDTVYFMDGLLEVGHWSPLFGYAEMTRIWSADIANGYTRIISGTRSDNGFWEDK
jgi:hypothetical protein